MFICVKYCDNIRDKAVFTIGWDMVSRNHELPVFHDQLPQVIGKQERADTGIRRQREFGRGAEYQESPFMRSFGRSGIATRPNIRRRVVPQEFINRNTVNGLNLLRITPQHQIRSAPNHHRHR